LPAKTMEKILEKEKAKPSMETMIEGKEERKLN
jgi:hypothetical protein